MVAEVKSSYYKILTTLAVQQAKIPNELATQSIKEELASADIRLAHTQRNIVNSQYATTETIQTIEDRTSKFANNKMTYNDHPAYLQKIIPLKDSGHQFAEERNKLKSSIKKLIENFYTEVHKIAQEGLKALSSGKTDSETKKLVDKQLTSIIDAVEKEKTKLQEQVNKLSLNEGSLQKGLDTLELETRHVSLTAGIPVQPVTKKQPGM